MGKTAQDLVDYVHRIATAGKLDPHRRNIEIEKRIRAFEIEDVLRGLRRGGEMDAFYLFNHEQFSVVVWALQSGQKIPMHDHPGMRVYGKVCLGEMSIENGTGEIIALRKDDMFGVSPDDNFHAIKAVSDCLFIEAIHPPYTEARDCTYYVRNANGTLERTSVPEGMMPQDS